MAPLALAVLVMLVVGGVVLAKRAGWLTGSEEDLRQAERAEDAARAAPHHAGPFGG